MSCEHAHDGGAYVLGALAPSDRLAFERHLADCAACTTGVRELAGLPGLLARVDPAVLTEAEPIPLPPGLSDRLLAQVGRERRRGRWLGVGAAAASAAVAAAATAALLHGTDRPATATPLPTPGQSMTDVAHAGISATMAMHSVPWGTRLELTCAYPKPGGEYHPPPGATYVLVIRTTSGRVEQVATWRGVDGKEIALAAATDEAESEIAAVELRDGHGRILLRTVTPASDTDPDGSESIQPL